MRLIPEGAKLLHCVSREVARLFISFLLFAGTPVQAALSPEIQKGLTWLQSQVQADGSLAGESTSLATPMQGRTETLVSLSLLATTSAPLANAIAANDEDNTEYLARQALSLSLAGQNIDFGITALLERQNTDGGFGGASGFDSNPLDTAWVLLALVQNGQGGTNPALGARSYLSGAILVDGGVDGASNAERIEVGALVLLALQANQSDLATANIVKNLTAWLLQLQGTDGSWEGDVHLTAETFAAISPFVADSVIRAVAQGYLTGKQSADGSWGQDPFITALALRALQLAGESPINPALGIIQGKIVDSQTNLPISGVTVALSGTSSATKTTGEDGGFTFVNMQPGAYNLTASLTNYGTLTTSTTAAASQTLDFGTLKLTKNSGITTGTIYGLVKDAATGTALGGVTIAGMGFSTQTDANGAYQVVNVASGDITISVSKTGYLTLNATGHVYAGGNLLYSPVLSTSGITVTASTVAGIVMDAATEQTLAGVSIAVTDGAGTRMITTGADGKFSAANLVKDSKGGVNFVFSRTSYVGADTYALIAGIPSVDIGQVRMRKAIATHLLPDLQVSSTSRTSAITDPQSLILSGNVAATIVNLGTASATIDVEMMALYDKNGNGVYDAGIDTVLGTAVIAGGIVQGASQTISIPVAGTLPFRDTPILVWADSTQSVIELNENNNIRNTCSACEMTPPVGTFNPVLKWQWTGSPSAPTKNWVHGPVAVAPLHDDNGDGRIDQNDTPYLVFTAGDNYYSTNSSLVALSGKDGSELWIRNNLDITHRGSVAIADIDGDRIPDIVGSNRDRTALLAFNHDGTLKWRVPTGPQYVDMGVSDGIAIADLAQDGHPAIVQGQRVYNGDGSLRWVGTGDAGGPNNWFGGWGNTPIAADVNPSPGMEVVAGRTLYSATGQTLWHRGDLPGDGFNAIANFTKDAHPQIVLVTHGQVYLLSYTGQTIWGPVAIPGGGFGGPPTVADFDGDGIPDIGIAGGTRYVVINGDGSIKWSTPTQDLTSGVTGSSLFDFKGDGKAQVLYADEINFYVFDGATGARQFTKPNTSVTTLEYPVIVDIDGDSHADIVVSSNAYGPNPTRGIRIFQDANNSWVSTRKIWNQHSYHITNINDDGTVPRVEKNSWETSNTYRLNAFPDRSATAVTDLTASFIRIQDRGGVTPSTFTVRIGNGGGLQANAGVKVAFYNGVPKSGGVLLGVATTTTTLASGQFEDVNFNYPNTLAGISTLTIVVDDDGTGKGAIQECDEMNNSVSMNLSALPGSFSLNAGTNAPSYAANTDVQITAIIANHGSFDGSAQVRFVIQTDQGDEVAMLPTQSLTVPHGGQSNVIATWNTGTTIAGAYQVKAQLVDGNGVPFTNAQTAFNIVGPTGSALAGAKLTTDKQSYLPSDTINLNDRISSLTQNLMLEGLTAVTTIYQPDGSVFWSQTTTLAQLLPAAFKDLNYSVNLAMATAGAYRAELSLHDSAGTELVRTETAFTVQSTAATGSGLTGSVSTAAKQVYQGDPLLINSTVNNLGNAAMMDLPVTLTLIDPASQAALTSWPATINLAKGGTYQSAQTWMSATGKVNTTYLAVLTALIGGKTLTLGYDTFTVVEPPVKLDIKQTLSNDSRVLVLLSCKNSEGSAADDKTCLDARAQYLDATLTTLGIEHLVTVTLDDFKPAFRSGKYNTYWISGGAQKLDAGLAQEVREAVNRSDGLLLDGIHDERNGLLDEVPGILYRGKLSARDQPITLTGPLLAPGTVVHTSGQALKLALDSGTQQAKFPAALKCDDCTDTSDKNGTTPGDTAAIVGNAYGKGRGIVMAFDLVGALMQTQSVSPTWQDILQTTFSYLAPPTPDLLTAGAYAVALTTLANQGLAVALEVTDLLPAGASVVSTAPQATVDPDRTQAKWNLDLAVGQSTGLTLALRAPETSGSHTLTTTVNSIRNGQSKLYGSYPLALNVASAMELTVIHQLIADLQALSFTASHDRETRDQAVKALQDAIDLTAQGKNEDALQNLLDAIDKLRRIESKDMSAYRFAVDRWLQELELEWLNAPLGGK